VARSPEAPDLVFERVTVITKGKPHDKTADRRVRVDTTGDLWIDEVVELTHDAACAISVELAERTIVRLRKPQGGFAIAFTAQEEAHALVEALGRPSERVVTEVALEPSLLVGGFRALPWWKTALLVMLAMLLVLVVPGLHANRSLLGATAAFHRTLEIGVDGIRVRSGVVDEFLSYAQIAEVTVRRDSIVIRQQGGRESVLPLEHGARALEVVARIQKAAAAAGAVATATRAERSETASLLGGVGGAELRSIGTESDASYRACRVPRERLWSMVEDPSATEAIRARAAVALSGALSAEDRGRLRAVADLSVSPKVRVAVDAALGASKDPHLDERRIDAALAALDTPEELDEVNPASSARAGRRAKRAQTR